MVIFVLKILNYFFYDFPDLRIIIRRFMRTPVKLIRIGKKNDEIDGNVAKFAKFSRKSERA